MCTVFLRTSYYMSSWSFGLVMREVVQRILKLSACNAFVHKHTHNRICGDHMCRSQASTSGKYSSPGLSIPQLSTNHPCNHLFHLEYKYGHVGTREDISAPCHSSGHHPSVGPMTRHWWEVSRQYRCWPLVSIIS